MSSIAAAHVVAIYPLQDRLPENILKFYVQFSEPMREGNFLHHLTLKNDKGENVSGVFFDNVYELWNSSHTQITLLVDPGRVKTGLHQNIKQGRAFVSNETYSLTIDSSWKTLKGHHLTKSFTKKFQIIEEDLTPPTISGILVSKIKTQSKEPLRITFDEALDALQIQDYVRIITEDKIVNGKFKLLNDGKSIQFTPTESWNDMIYKLRIDVRLEDIAANSFAGKFDQPRKDAQNVKHSGFLYKLIP